MFERPLILFLLLLAPVVAVPGLLAIRRGVIAGGAALTALRLAVFAALVLMLAGLRVTGRIAARRLALVVAVDRSASIAPDQLDWMRTRVAEVADAMGSRDRIAVLGFGREVEMIAPLSDPRIVGSIVSRRLAAPAADVDPGATDLAASLTAASVLFPPEAEKRLLILSDGNQTQGNASDELPAMVEAGVRIYTAVPPPPATPRVALTEFSAPEPVRAQASFAFRIAIESDAPAPIDAHLRLFGDDKPLGGHPLKLQPGLNRFELPYRIEHAGAYLMRAKLEVTPPAVALNPQLETPVSAIDAARVLVVSTDPPMSLLSALRTRRYEVTQASPRGLPQRPEGYLPYQAVILAEVSAQSLSEEAQRALGRYVADFGGGLVVTGEALRDGKFHGSALEKALPVMFRPQPPPPAREPVAVYLCIDRSNSMSYNSRYPALRDSERIRYAKQAAVALLRQLDDTDYAGVIAFDSQPYVLSRLRPLMEDRDELEKRIERLEPGGGTDFKEALEIAEHEILASGISVRQVILITDGDTNRQYHDHDALIADYADKHIPVSTIRIGPDLANLRLLEDFAQATGGTFYRVQDIEKLPQLLVRLTRKAMNKEQRGQIRIEYSGPSAILSGIDPREIPPLEFFATSEAKQGAVTPLKIHRGDHSAPLLAAWGYGLGRSVVFAGEPDSLGSLGWIRWDHYTEFWSQVVNWAMRPGESGLFSLGLEALSGGGLGITAHKADAVPAADLVCRVTGGGGAFDVAMTQVGESLYRGECGALPRGKYVATLMRKGRDVEQALLDREFAVAGASPADAAELRIGPPNRDLMRRLATETGGRFDAPVPVILKRAGATIMVRTRALPALIPLAIALLLGEVFVRRRLMGD